MHEVQVQVEDVILIRPPCEALSLLIGVTEGCEWDRRSKGGCRFCGVYTNVQAFRVRPLESIRRDIDRGFHQRGSSVRAAFLAGGNALCAPTSLLLEVIAYLNGRFPRLERISCYAKNHDILKKSGDELQQLHEAGLQIVYMGLESGSDDVLKYMNKGTTARGMIRAARKIKKSGIELSVYVILGLGGNLFNDHSIETARVLSEMNPEYIRFRSLNFIPNSRLFKEWRDGKFIALRPAELIAEEIDIIKNLDDSVTSMILNDHVSNFTSVQGKLPRDRDALIQTLDDRLKDERIINMKHVNRTSM
ncbi:MAG: radical SAM protein [Promethearchaeota archaeon]